MHIWIYRTYTYTYMYLLCVCICRYHGHGLNLLKKIQIKKQEGNYHCLLSTPRSFKGFVIGKYDACCGMCLSHTLTQTHSVQRPTWYKSTFMQKKKKKNTHFLPHTNTRARIQSQPHTVIHTRTHFAAPHFCLGKKVITFSPCINAFKSLSGAIPWWASEIHLNSFWESKQSYCCALKLWLEGREKNERRKSGRRREGRGRLVNNAVGRYYSCHSSSPALWPPGNFDLLTRF